MGHPHASLQLPMAFIWSSREEVCSPYPTHSPHRNQLSSSSWLLLFKLIIPTCPWTLKSIFALHDHQVRIISVFHETCFHENMPQSSTCMCAHTERINSLLLFWSEDGTHGLTWSYTSVLLFKKLFQDRISVSHYLAQWVSNF